MNKIIGLFGKGGFTREIRSHILKKYNNNIDIQIITDVIDKKDKDIVDIKNINKQLYNFLITTGDPKLRKYLYNKYPNLNYINYIHDCNNILDKDSINIGNGSIICAGSVLTTNITIGLCNHINLNSTIGHDTIVGDFVTCSPGVNISGNCKIGNNVLIGTNTAIREHITICDDVVIGMNSNIIKNVVEPGVYIGNPLRKLK